MGALSPPPLPISWAESSRGEAPRREGKGALVADVTKDSPAAEAGLKAGDVILEYDGHGVARESDLPRLVAATPVGRTCVILSQTHSG